MPSWVLKDCLARSSRPGYRGEKGLSVAKSEVDAWMKEAKELGIASIICLLAEDQLNLYDELPGGLVSYYRSFGFAVEHVPALDHQHPPLDAYHLERIWSAYQSLEKPVLIHCSAGIDRTGMAVQHIQNRLQFGVGPS